MNVDKTQRLTRRGHNFNNPNFIKFLEIHVGLHFGINMSIFYPKNYEKRNYEMSSMFVNVTFELVHLNKRSG